MDNSNVKTINDLANFGYSTEYSSYQCTLLTQFNNIILADSIVYDKYKKLLDENSSMISLSDAEQKQYANKPELLANMLYGNPALYHIILYMNNCSEIAFKPHIVKYLSQDAIENVLKLIISKESNAIEKSRKSIMG